MDDEQDCFENMAHVLAFTFCWDEALRMVVDVDGGVFTFSLLAFDSKDTRRASGSYTCTLLPPYTEPMRNDLRTCRSRLSSSHRGAYHMTSYDWVTQPPSGASQAAVYTSLLLCSTGQCERCRAVPRCRAAVSRGPQLGFKFGPRQRILPVAASRTRLFVTLHMSG